MIRALLLILFVALPAKAEIYDVTWAEMKSVKASMDLEFFHLDKGAKIDVYAPSPIGIFQTTLASQTVDADEFMDVYYEASNKPRGLKIDAFAASGFNFAAQAASMTVTAGAIGTIWVPIPDTDIYIDGGVMITSGTAIFDWASMYVIDKDGVFYPAGTVIKAWIEKRFIPPHNLCILRTRYAGLIPMGLYIRIQYHSFGEEDVQVAVNLDMHKKS